MKDENKSYYIVTKEEIIEMFIFFQKVFEAVIEIEELIDVEGYSKKIPKSMLEGLMKVGIIEENKNGKTEYKIAAKEFGSKIKSEGRKALKEYQNCINELIQLIYKIKKLFYGSICINEYLHKHPEIFRLTESGEINLENSDMVVSEYNVLDYFYAKIHECLLFVEKQKYTQYQDVLTGIVEENFHGTSVEKEVQSINKKIQELNAKWNKKVNVKRYKWGFTI